MGAVACPAFPGGLVLARPQAHPLLRAAYQEHRERRRAAPRNSAGSCSGRRRHRQRDRAWRSYEYGNDGSLRSRQEEEPLAWRWRRWQHDEDSRPRLQEEDGRRRRWFIVWAPKDHDRAVDESQFVRVRRRNAEVDEGKIRFGIERRGKHGQPTPRVQDVRIPSGSRAYKTSRPAAYCRTRNGAR